MPTPRVLASSNRACMVPWLIGMAMAARTAATNKPHWARISTRSLPTSSVSTPAEPLTTRVGRVSMAKCRASSRGFWLPCINSQPLAVRPAKDPAVLSPEATKNVVR